MKNALFLLVLVACSPAESRPVQTPEPEHYTAREKPHEVDEVVDGPTDRLCHEQYGLDEIAIQELVDTYKIKPTEAERQRAEITKRREKCARRFGDPR